MTALFRLLDVPCQHADRVLTFTLHAGETRLLQLVSKAEKELMLDLCMGVIAPLAGKVEVAQGDRRHGHAKFAEAQGERRVQQQSVPMIWRTLFSARAGRVGWVAANGGLISNLKVWENVTLPLWFHAPREVAETELSVAYWLPLLGLEPDEFADFMAAPPSSIEPSQKKLAGLLRGLVQMPRVLIVDAALFEDVKARLAQKWITALETYAAQGRAVLVIADKAVSLPWGVIE